MSKHNSTTAALDSGGIPTRHTSLPAHYTSCEFNAPDPVALRTSPRTMAWVFSSPEDDFASALDPYTDKGTLLAVGDWATQPHIPYPAQPLLGVPTSLSENQLEYGHFPDTPSKLEEPAGWPPFPSTPSPLPSAQLSPLAAKPEVPLTDSGYGSAAGLALHVHATGHKPADDCQTEYSDATTVPQAHAQSYIRELCQDIYTKLGPHVSLSGKDMAMLSALIKALAIKIALHEPSQVNSDIMYFIHKHHRSVNALLYTTEKKCAVANRR